MPAAAGPRHAEDWGERRELEIAWEDVQRHERSIRSGFSTGWETRAGRQYLDRYNDVRDRILARAFSAISIADANRSLTAGEVVDD